MIVGRAPDDTDVCGPIGGKHSMGFLIAGAHIEIWEIRSNLFTKGLQQ
jgi:hypothetical protein